PTQITVMEIAAAVVPEKFGAFTIDRLELTDPRPDEALVRIVASGMCQTDLHGRDHEDRLALARALGATHAINHRGRSDVVAEIRRITGDGVRFSLETSAQPAVFREAGEALIAAGTCVLLGSARSGTEVSFEMPFLQFGRVVRGVIQGHPQEFIPRLVDFLMQGKMPVERMMTFYPLAEINRAAQDSSQGTTIKPVLRMPN